MPLSAPNNFLRSHLFEVVLAKNFLKNAIYLRWSKNIRKTPLQNNLKRPYKALYLGCSTKMPLNAPKHFFKSPLFSVVGKK